MAEEYGKIRKSLMTGIADAIRSKKNTTAIFTPTQMAVEIEGIITGDDLPNVEDTTFGTVAGPTEYGITNYRYNSGDSSYSASDNVHVGYSFEVVETFAVSGFRFYHVWSGWPGYACLWDSDGNLLAWLAVTTSAAKAWTEAKFDNPINVVAGKTYTVSINLGSAKKLQEISYNSKITNVQAKAGTYSNNSSDVSMPTTDIDNSFAYGIIDIIMTDAVGISEIDNYKIQRTTMTAIADEMIRITGGTSKISVDQIVTALQGISPTS